jgi:S-DNA-T family DNA segregation ATPase FtsK/SpoIIIE
MGFLASIFTPTGNRRLNELIGFLMCVSALLLFLALASYSPLDPSLNSASVLTGTHAARNWIGVVGALLSDITLQFFGLGAFLLPVFPAVLGIRWFVSRKIQSPLAKSLGATWLAVFIPALLALLPGHLRWLNVIPVEGLLGRIVGDVLIHYLNLAGAFIVCASVLEPLPGLAGRSRQAPATKRSGQATGVEAAGENTIDSIEAGRSGRSEGGGGAATHRHRAHA